MSKRKLSEEDQLVLATVNLHGIGIRKLLEHALKGKDPNNILARLLHRGLLQAVRGALPRNRAYYLPSNARPLGAQALEQRLAIAWHCLVAPPGVTRFLMSSAVLKELFGLQAPRGPHTAERKGHRWCVRRLYIPLGEDIVTGASRHLRKAHTYPQLTEAIEQELYGFSVLTDWGYSRSADLSRALSGGRVAGMKQIIDMPTASFRVERSPRTSSLSLATQLL